MRRHAMHCQFNRLDPLRLIAGVLAAGMLALCSATAAAAAYPNRTVKIIVPFAAGGPADIYARFVAQKLAESTGQSFIIDNRSGAGSIIGTDAVAKSPADGY